MIYYKAKENNCIKSLNKQQHNIKDGRRESVSKLPQPQYLLSPKKITHAKKQKNVTHTQEKQQATETERVQMSHLIDTGFKEATINMFEELKETRIREKKWKM